MALIKLAPFIVDIRGQLGGVYFKGGPDGHHCQAMPRSYTKQQSGARMLFTQAFTSAAGMIATLLALELIVAWVAFSAQYIYKTAKGNWTSLTWWNWFLKFNVGRIAKGYPPYTHPPRSPTDLPAYAAVCENFREDTLNFYRFDSLYGYPTYWCTDHWLWLWGDDSGWYISEPLGYPLPRQYWSQPGADPKGTYHGSTPDLHDMFVSF